MCISTAQAHRIWWARAGALGDCARVVVLYAFSGLVITLRSKHEENLFFWWSNVDFS